MWCIRRAVGIRTQADPKAAIPLPSLCRRIGAVTPPEQVTVSATHMK